MKVLLEIQDNKSAFILELLKNFSFVKTTKLSDTDTKELSDSQKSAINEGILSLEKEKSTPHDQLIKETKRKYPDLFR